MVPQPRLRGISARTHRGWPPSLTAHVRCPLTRRERTPHRTCLHYPRPNTCTLSAPSEEARSMRDAEYLDFPLTEYKRRYDRVQEGIGSVDILALRQALR